MADQSDVNAELENLPNGGHWFRVCLNTIVRKSVELDSERLRILPMGSRVRVVARKGRRVQISQPIEGWCSMQSSNGDTILQKIEDKAEQQPITTPKVSEVGNQLKQQQKLLEQQMNEETNDEELEKLKKQHTNLQVQLENAQQQIENYRKQMSNLQSDFGPDSPGDGGTKSATDNMGLRNGDTVLITPPVGIAIVRYYGEVKGQQGIWVGVELSDPGDLGDGTPIGDTDGTIGGVEYFSCAPDHGKFFPPSDIVKVVPAESLLLKLTQSLQRIAMLEETIIKNSE